MKFNLISITAQIILFFTSLLVAIILFIDPNLSNYRDFLPFLPLVFSLGCIVFINIYSFIFKSIAISIIVFTYYIRMVITPFFMKFSYYQRNGIVADIDNTFNLACLLMIYEFILVFWIISFFGKKYALSTNNLASNLKMNITKNMYNTVKKFLYISTAVVICFVVVYPEILTHYKFFVFLSEEHSIEWYRNNAIAKQNVPLIIYYIITWTINILKNVWVLVIIFALRSKGVKKINLFLSIIIIVINALISSGNTAYSLYFSIAFFIVLAYLYPNSKRIILATTASLIVAIVFVGLLSLAFISSEGSSNALFKLSNTLQAYFTGPANVAISLMIENYNLISIMVADFFTSLPLLRTVFVDMTNSTVIFNQVAYGLSESGGQIIPSVGLGNLYFGFILAPIFSCLFTYFSLKYSYKFLCEVRLPYKFLYQFISILLACMPVLYNYYIFLIGLFTYILPTWIFVRILTKKLDSKNKGIST